MNVKRFLWIFLGVLTLIRYGLIGGTGLLPEEMYYFQWAENPDWAYYSGGPGVALAIKLGTSLFGETAFGVRFLVPLLGLGASWFLFLLGSKLYNERAGMWAVVLLNLTPIFNAGNVFMGIDILSVFFWSVGLWGVWHIGDSEGKGKTGWWLFVGLVAGLAFLCEYRNGFFVLLVGVWLLVCEIRRKQQSETAQNIPGGLKYWGGFMGMCLVFLIAAAPVFYWLSQHEWVTLSHVRITGLGGGGGVQTGAWAGFVGEHLVWYSPLIFIGVILAVGSIAWGKNKKRGGREYFLLVFGLPWVLFYFILAFNGQGEITQTIPGWISLGILTVGVWEERLARSRRQAAWNIGGGLALSVGAVMTVLLFHTDTLRPTGAFLRYEQDPGGALWGWESATTEVERIRNEFEARMGETVFLIGDSHLTAASIGFYLKEKRPEAPEHPPVYIPESQNIESQFSFWPRYDAFIPTDDPRKLDPFFTEQRAINPFMGRTALFITVQDSEKPTSAIDRGFADWELIAVIEVKRFQISVKTLRVFACYNYQTQPL